MLSMLIAEAERAGPAADTDPFVPIDESEATVRVADRLRLERLLRDSQQLARDPVICLSLDDDGAIRLNAGDDRTEPAEQPGDLRELVQRIAKTLRRTRSAGTPQRVDVAGIHLSDDEHRVSIGNRPVAMSPAEYRLLKFFLTHRHRVYSRRELLAEVWGRSGDIDERTVDVHVRRLRKILADHHCDGLLQTVRGYGYRFSEVA